MTQAERDVIEAARAAVDVTPTGRVIVADITSNGERLGALVKAVVALNRERASTSYWR
ncbi:MAG TPA: hypothetical protein VIU86_19900 [Gaiellaceae bacterium]